jgi:hypothetical protein
MLVGIRSTIWSEAVEITTTPPGPVLRASDLTTVGSFTYCNGPIVYVRLVGMIKVAVVNDSRPGVYGQRSVVIVISLRERESTLGFVLRGDWLSILTKLSAFTQWLSRLLEILLQALMSFAKARIYALFLRALDC